MPRRSNGLQLEWKRWVEQFSMLCHSDLLLAVPFSTCTGHATSRACRLTPSSVLQQTRQVHTQRVCGLCIVLHQVGKLSSIDTPQSNAKKVHNCIVCYLPWAGAGHQSAQLQQICSSTRVIMMSCKQHRHNVLCPRNCSSSIRQQ